jgi:hypothetical protein
VTDDDKAFLEKYIREGNRDGECGALAVEVDPRAGMEVLTWDGLPVASRKLVYVDGEPRITAMLWGRHPEIPKEVEKELLKLDKLEKGICVGSPPGYSIE